MTAIAYALVLVPAVASLGLAFRSERTRPVGVLVAVTALVSALAIVALVTIDDGRAAGGWVDADATARLFLAMVNPISLGVAAYVWSRVSSRPELRATARRFACLALAFLAACNAVLLSHHLVVMWIALEASTVAAAALIVRPGVRSSHLASWRYLLFSSIGLGLAFLGFLCLARAAEAAPWQPLGLSLVLLGLGTKLGLAPMYSWLPEAYDEAPPAVTALLGSVQFNCALVMLFRVVHVYRPLEPELVTGQLLAMGIVSMLVSTVSIIATRNMKRLIAYASINHAGVIAIGLGVGKSATFGLMLYVICNAFIKAILFLTAGKIEAHYLTKDTRAIAGLIKDLPYSGVFLMVGTFALLGFPPFGSFFGELLILSELVSSGQMLVFAAFCALVAVSFVATGRTTFPMIWGQPSEAHTWPRQTFLSASPKIVFVVALVALGIYVPPGVSALIQDVVVFLEGT